jgi:hypothetical protein
VFEADCTDNIVRVDRVYAYEPPLDRRYIGFCRSHTLELDFGDRLSALGPQDKVFLFIHGFIEYPYSQTTYAASQSRVGWEPIRIDRLGKDGPWQTIVPDGGAPGGMARMMTIDLSGKVDPQAAPDDEPGSLLRPDFHRAARGFAAGESPIRSPG